MKYMGLNELRESFLSFFESKGHLRLPSFPLIPQNDNSLLLINSGMAPMKPYFQGTQTPPRSRVCTCQKCIRTPDLENVGKTARHGTYFEMLGNFSFGDYFKNEAIPWAWEFLTVTLGIPADKLWPSVYEGDDEAYNIWKDVIGVPEEKIIKLGKADNFWEHGTGPCGPCSEIYFDRGEKYGCGSPDCKPGCECDRYMEIWNNVFSQFNSDGNGNYTELSQKNIDTGMGLERLACVMQGVDNLFEVDTVRRILDTVCEYSGKKYGADYKDDVSIRIITDHIRSTSFMIADGVLPSNEGRGYVLRRLIRRACRNGRLIGIKKAFLSSLADVVIKENGNAYPELCEKADYIKKVLSMEEQSFDKTIDKGLEILAEKIDGLEKSGKKELPGADLFKLYDTYGFPADLVIEILEEKGFTANTDEFKACMDEQKRAAREGMRDNDGWKKKDGDLLAAIEKTEFLGYESDECDAGVAAIIADGELVSNVSGGKFTLVLDKTVFYGEGGGQVGDTGVITFDGGSAEVLDTKKSDGKYMHICTLTSGELKTGDKVCAAVNVERRNAIRRNHSAVHLLQAALRRVLGTHVEQAGSYVDDNSLRFDFTHFSQMTPEEIKKTELEVNAEILRGSEITVREMPIDEAKALGAMALFGEKYGDTVRVVKMGEYSIELCGGTHLDNTAKAGIFKIVSESSVAAGVRRIEAVCGMNVIKKLDELEDTVAKVAAALKSSVKEVVSKAEHTTEELRTLRAEISAMNSRMARLDAADYLNAAEDISGVKFVAKKLKDAKADDLRAICDELKALDSSVCAVLAGVNGEKIVFTATCGKDVVARGIKAGDLVRETAKAAGGNGGGKPDFAMAGGNDVSKTDEALKTARAFAASKLQ